MSLKDENQPINVFLNVGQVNTASDVTMNYYESDSHKEKQPEAKTGEEQASDSDPHSQRDEDRRRLAAYIQDPDRRAMVVAMLAEVTSAHDLAFQVVAQLHEEPFLTRDIVVKRQFIETLLKLAPRIEHGKSVDNMRAQINKMLIAQWTNWK